MHVGKGTSVLDLWALYTEEGDTSHYIHTIHIYTVLGYTFWKGHFHHYTGKLGPKKPVHALYRI